MTVVKNGDRVRVVLEGEAKSPNLSDGGFLIGRNSENLIVPDWDHVVSVEVLAKQFKVGDTVSGDDYAKLPVGTLVRHFGGVVRIKRGDDDWPNILDKRDVYRITRALRTIAYLPDAS